MQVSNSYYEDEIRDGFYIHGMMKRAWVVAVEVLGVVDAICKKYDIQYFADAGTLLGAVRHKGFIPWDDDLDICMRREDYNRFWKIAEEELPEKFKIINIHTQPNYDEIFSRVVNRDTISFDKKDLEKSHGFPFVAGIDIFALDYIAPNEEEEKLRCDMAMLVEDIAKSIEAIECDEEREALICQVEEMCGVKIDRNGHLKNQLMLLEECLMSMYGLEEAEELALIPVWMRTGSNKFKKEYYESTVEMDFENIKIPVPTMYDAVLRQKYGDYMKLIHNWDYHNYPFYGKQMKMMEAELNYKFPKYEFSGKDLLCEDRMEKTDIKQQAEGIISVLKEAHGEIGVALGQGTVDVVLELLEACQQGAIAIGTMLEEACGEGVETIGLLESYCEYLYQVYGALVQGNEMAVEDIGACLVQMENAIADSIQNDVKIRKEVVFICYKANMWNAIESVWKAACKDEDCDVYVVPVPYYEKNIFGEFGEKHYEGEQFPDYVQVTKYQEYDLTARKPDKIFIQSPYDGYGHGISIEPAYYSSCLKYYTKELIYIPYFILDEINPRDARAMASMEYFVKMPGVVYADKVIVQSEVMKERYIEALVEFAGEETRSIWEEKILGFGSPLQDAVSTNEAWKKVPQEWVQMLQKADGKRKKLILYHISASTFEQNGEKLLEKIKRVAETFAENKSDVVALWYLEPWETDVIKSHKPMLWGEYQVLVQHIQTEGCGVYNDTMDAKDIVEICDAYYGDTGSVAQLCRMKGMPVMIQDVECV